MTDVSSVVSKPRIRHYRRLKPENRKGNFYLFFLDPQLDIVWLNQSFSDLCKQDSSFFIGKRIFNFFQDIGLRTAFNLEKKTGLLQRGSDKLEVHFPLVEQLVIECQWSLISYQNEKGWVTGYFLVIHDH